MSLQVRLKRKFNNQYQRDDFILSSLAGLKPGSKILDAGAGSQRYRSACSHLIYSAQDFGEYTVDEKVRFDDAADGVQVPYQYGAIDYLGDIRSIDVPDNTFDAILCTEVLEHISHPIEAIGEFQRILRPGGVLILTFPSNCLRHFDPYFYTSGFSDRWVEEIMSSFRFDVLTIQPVGDYYSWMATETLRTIRAHSILAKVALAPSLTYFSLKRKTEGSVNTLCMGYHVVAMKT